MNRNRTSVGTIQTSNARIAIVNSVLTGDENRFARAHPIGPAAASGGGKTDTLWLRTKMSSSVTAIIGG